MNTTMYDPAIDERFEGEDAADALFAAVLLEPPKWLDERILSFAHNAAIAREEEFSRLEQLADAMFAKLMVEPPADLDQQIMANAKSVLIPNKPTLVEIIVNGLKFLVEKIFTPEGPIYVHNCTYAFALAAEQEDEQDQQSKRMRDCVLYGESKVEYRLPGEWSFHVGSDPSDPSHRTIHLYFSEERKNIYEGCTAELRQGDGSVLLSGTIKYGRIKAKLPADVILGPPFTLQVQLQNVQEL